MTDPEHICSQHSPYGWFTHDQLLAVKLVSGYVPSLRRLMTSPPKLYSENRRSRYPDFAAGKEGMVPVGLGEVGVSVVANGVLAGVTELSDVS